MGKSKVIGKPGITFDLGELPNGWKASYSAGYDIGLGEYEALGGDAELTWDSEVWGPNASVTVSGFGLIGTVELAGGAQGFRFSANGGFGGVAGAGGAS